MKPRKKKFTRKEPMKKPKRKEKFNYRTASYIKEREARVEEVENRRKRIEEVKAKQQAYESDSTEEEEEDPVTELLKTFNGKDSVKVAAIDSESSEEEEEEEQDNEEQEEDEQEVDSDGDSDVEDADDVDLENEEDEDGSGVESSELEEADDLASDEDASDTEQEESEIENRKRSKSAKSVNKKKSKGNKDEGSDQECDVEIDNEEDEETAKEDAGHVRDPFTIHYRNDLDSELYAALTSQPPKLKIENISWPVMGNIVCKIPTVHKKVEEPKAKKPKVTILEETTYAEHGKVPKLIKNVNWNELYVKSLIQNNISKANYDNIKDGLDKNPSPLTPLQKELFSVMNNYQDLLYTERTFENASQIRFAYCLHAMNHVLKTRTKVLHHNAKIQKSKLNGLSEIPDEYRDQGLVRPKVLILVPFRHSCFEIVKLLISIFIGEDRGGSVINKNRFMEDFGSGNEIIMPKKNPKPEDYEQTFKGNTDDTFKIGLSITKKALKLYSDFYSSDIIISSVLGLRITIGAEGEEERDYDFLASIEMLIMDQMEVFFMQNWDHLLHVLDHLHLQPRSSHGTDFGRVRSWCVNGWSKYYRQSLLFSHIQLPEIENIFNRRCSNYAGRLRPTNPVAGSIGQVVAQVPQVFQRFDAGNYLQAIDARFEYFTKHVLPQYRDGIMNHCMIFVPSYLDYVRLRNYFRREELSFVQICEYSQDAKVARARDMFFHGDTHFLLYTERFHFFRRVRIKGIRHIIFYAPPAFPHLYSEMCNLMQEAYQNPRSGSASNTGVTVLYCKYDAFQLASIVGTERAAKMIASDKQVHMLMTGD